MDFTGVINSDISEGQHWLVFAGKTPCPTEGVKDTKT